jgi:energy-converting hydrogenase A subunit R
MNNFISFSLEGTLSPQNNARELVKLLPNGERFFEVISRYDDLLALEGREDYEPGDTLALILPFLILHGISENDIVGLAANASFVSGAEKLVSWLQSKGWKVFCITTTYEPYARHLTHKLGIYAHNVACTSLPWDKLRLTLGEKELTLIKQAGADILGMKPVNDDDRIRKRLDSFFWEKLPATGLGEIMREVKPVGGRRKLVALGRFGDKYDQSLANWVIVGDSITDFRMLEAVDAAGGLAIAFNGDEYALPYATVGLASTSVSHLTDVLEAWRKGKRKGAEKVVRGREKSGGSDDKGYFHWLAGRNDIDEVIEIHKGLRRLVKEEAGKPG